MKLTIFLSISGILFVFCETAGTQSSECDRRGTVRSKHYTDKKCKCKANVIGQNCDQCKPNTFDLSRYNPLGCTQCFCMGITDECQSLAWPKGEITELFDISMQKSPDDNSVLLPEKFLKNQLLSYGRVLLLTIELIKTVNSAESIEELGDIEIFSETQNITLSYWYSTPLSESFSELYYVEKVVSLHENDWYLTDDSQVSRNQFLMVLAEISAIKIRIEYKTLRCALSKVELQTAVENGNGENIVYDVEKCDCPAGYTGTSCEKCTDGYKRIFVEPYLGNCVVNCNGHADKWDENTQSCVNCAHNTAGKYCHLCAHGYEGNATTDKGCGLTRSIRNSVDSKEKQYDAVCICERNVVGEGCNCPDSLSSSHPAKIVDEIKSVKCDGRGSSQLLPDSDGKCNCKDNVMGETCNECKPNTFDLSWYNPLGCTECICMGITQTCHSLVWHKEMITQSFGVPNEVDFGYGFIHLPEKFLKNRLLSYGGILKLTINLVRSLDFDGSTGRETDIEIYSATKKIRLYHSYSNSLNFAFSGSSRTIVNNVFLKEYEWHLFDDIKVSKSQFLTILATITTVRVKIRYNKFYCHIADVSLETAIEEDNESTLTYEMEKCDCPAGYNGTSCEDCADGYYRRHGGIYLGICEKKTCNGHSGKWDVNTGFCLNCKHNTAGEHCHLCAPGYHGNAITEKGCKPSPSSNCHCNSAGTKNNQCNGDCICKENVEGEICDRCKPLTFGLSAENEYGCNKCFCSGVTDQCHESLYYTKMISGFGDISSGLQIFDTETGKPMNDDMEIGYWIPDDTTTKRFTLVLPSIYYGNRARSYGGYLRLIVEFGGALEIINPTIIITLLGNGIKLTHRTNSVLLPNEEISNLTIPLRESYWQVSTEKHGQATREDFMIVLLNLREIAVYGPTAEGLEIIHLRSISMDEATVDYSPGLKPTKQIEICKCPRGYIGESCETCSREYYRDIRDKTVSLFGACKPCLCTGHWKGCELSGTGEIMCLCEDGYSGDDCKAEKIEWQLSVNMRVKPERQTVEPGGVATITCSIDFRDADDEADFLDHERPSLDSQVQLEWIREDNDPLPPDNTISDGILTINNVERVDTGVYVCRGLKDGEVEFIWAKSYLHVGIPPKITLNPNNESVDLGDDVSIVCHASGDYPMTIVWTGMYRNLIPSEVDDGNGRLTFNGIATTDVGRYVCNATNEAGTATAVAQVLTTSPECN